MNRSEDPAKKGRPGPKADVLKVSLPVAEGLRRLVSAPPVKGPKKARKPKKTA